MLIIILVYFYNNPKKHIKKTKCKSNKTAKAGY